MKKRVLSLILILPFIVMFIVFGFSHTVNLFVNLAAEDLSWDYEEHEAMEYSTEAWANGVELMAHVSPSALQSKVKIDWEIIDEETFNSEPLYEGEHIAEIRDGNRLYKLRDGRVTIAATIEGSPIFRTFTAYLFDLDGISTGPQAVIITGSDYSVSSIKSTQYRDFGIYDIKDGQKVGATETFTVRVFPSAYQVEKINADVYGLSNVTVSPTENNACTVTIGMDGNTVTDSVYELVATVEGSDVTNHVDFIARDGVNVRSYDDLMYCTNSAHPEVICLRTSLESAANVANNSKFGLFGRRDEKNNIVCDYTEIQSTYDVKFYKNQKGYTENDTLLKVGVHFYKNVYGNGYTLNAHELTYPSGEMIVDGVTKASLTEDDIFRGPLKFVSAVDNASCYGQDNIGFLVEGDVTVDNITLKNCNNVDNLSNLDYVGTVVEVAGNNVTIKNSQLMNGRTVLRTMSNKNVTVDACMLSYAREFILKIGSNEFVYAPSGLSDTEQTFERLSPSQTSDGINIADEVKSTAIVRNSYFHTSGIFCVGMDTHFAGPYLYNRNPFKSSWGIYDMAATSYPSELTLEGDVKFYDWKTVSGLDSSTLLSIDQGSKYANIFDISDIIAKYDEINKDNELLYHGEDGELYVHGGVAFFGGGRNLSRVDFRGLTEDAKQYFINHNDISFGGVYGDDGATPLNDGGFAISLNNAVNDYYKRPKHGISVQDASILYNAAGEGDFKFYIYDASKDAAAISLIGKVPTVNVLRVYAD